MVTSKSISNGIVRAVITLALLTLLLFFLYKIKDIIVYVLISLVISLIAAPVINFLKKRLKFSNTIAVATTLILFFTLFVGLFLLFIPLVNSQSDNLALLDTNNLKNQITNVYSKILVYLQNYNIKINKSDITSKIDFGFISNFFNSLVGFVGNLGITVATTFFISFFFLKDKILFSKIINKVIPESHEEKFFNSFDKIKILLSRYFIGLIAQLSVVFVLYLAVLLIFGIENAFVIAFLCALLNIIPYIGPLIGTVLASILTLLANIDSDFQNVALPTMIYVGIGFFVVQLIDNNITSPLIFSKSVDSHPLEIFLIILIIGTLFGIAGMIVAIPLYTIIKVVCKEFFPDNKVIQILTKSI